MRVSFFLSLGFTSELCYQKPLLLLPVAMDDLYEKLAHSFTTRLGEEEDIPVEDDQTTIKTLDGVRTLVGRVVSQKVFFDHSLKMNIRHLLQPVRGFSFQVLGSNKFVFQSNHPLDCTLAL